MRARPAARRPAARRRRVDRLRRRPSTCSGRRRQAGQIEVEPPRERDFVRRWSRSQTLFDEFCADEVIDRPIRRGSPESAGVRSACTTNDPATPRPARSSGGAMLSAGRSAFCRWRPVAFAHRGRPWRPVSKVRSDRLAWNDCVAATEIGQRPLLRVEPQFRVTFVLVRTVTGKAVFRQDRPNVAIEGDRRLGRFGRSLGRGRSTEEAAQRQRASASHQGAAVRRHVEIKGSFGIACHDRPPLPRCQIPVRSPVLASGRPDQIRNSVRTPRTSISYSISSTGGRL